MPDRAQNLSYSYTRPRLGAVANNATQGSIDAGGPADKVCAAWVGKDTPAAMVAQSGMQQWSYENFGIPYYAPSFIDSVKGGTMRILGAFTLGYHGYQRSGGKALTMALWAFAGSIVPLPTLAVALVDGFGQRKRATRA